MFIINGQQPRIVDFVMAVKHSMLMLWTNAPQHMQSLSCVFVTSCILKSHSALRVSRMSWYVGSCNI